MAPDDVDAFFACRTKVLPAAPTWLSHKSRVGELKARLPIEIDGAVPGPELEITLQTTDPDYIVLVIIAPHCIARLCIGTNHRNRVTGETTTAPHFHPWETNRGLTARLRSTLPFVVELPENVRGRDAAFTWFLDQVGIESPEWLPIVWPSQGKLL